MSKEFFLERSKTTWGSEQQHALAQFALSVSRSSDVDEVLRATVDLAVQQTKVSGGASIVLWDNEMQVFYSAFTTIAGQQADYVYGKIRREGGASRWIVENLRPLIVDNTAADPFRANELLVEVGNRAYAGVPLFSGGEPLGVLYLMNRTPHKFDNGEVDFALTLAGYASSAVKQARLQARLLRQNEQLDVYSNLLQTQYDQLAHLHQKLKQVDALKSKFVNDIMHELRTPLTAFSVYVDLLERNGGVAPERHLKALKTSVQRLNQIVEEGEENVDHVLLEMDVESAESPPTVNFNTLIEPVVAMYKPAIDSRHVSLTIDKYDGLPLTAGRPDLISTALANLLSNAVHYTVEGSITIETYVEQTSVCYRVSDTGYGIEADEIGLVFDRYYRGRGIGQSHRPGIGLGLTIARVIAEAYGGEIDIQSEPNVGTAVTLCLPILSNSPKGQTKDNLAA